MLNQAQMDFWMSYANGVSQSIVATAVVASLIALYRLAKMLYSTMNRPVPMDNEAKIRAAKRGMIEDAFAFSLNILAFTSFPPVESRWGAVLLGGCIVGAIIALFSGLFRFAKYRMALEDS